MFKTEIHVTSQYLKANFDLDVATCVESRNFSDVVRRKWQERNIPGQRKNRQIRKTANTLAAPIEVSFGDSSKKLQCVFKIGCFLIKNNFFRDHKSLAFRCC